MEHSALITGGTVNGNGNSVTLNNNAVVTGVVFNGVNFSSGLYVSFQGCTFNKVTGFPSKASFTGCQFNNCNASPLEATMTNCNLIGCTFERIARISNSLISNCDLGNASFNIEEVVNNSITNTSEIYVSKVFTGNDCDDSKISVRNNSGQVTITGNNFTTSSSGFSTNIVDVHTTTGGRYAVNISNNNFIGNTTLPSGQYIRLYGDYSGTRCIVKISNNIFIGGSAKAVSYECTGQVDLVVNDNDMRATSGGWGVSDGGFIEFRNNFSY